MELKQFISYDVENFNAGGKAKMDAVNIAESCGFKKNYHPTTNKLVKVIYKLFNLCYSRNVILFYQYPCERKELLFLHKKIVNYTRKKIILIHDLDSLRQKGKLDKYEIDFIKCFDVIIAHTESMKKLLQNSGVVCPIVVLEIFDYITDKFTEHMHLNLDNKNKICFAGNLGKSKFLKEINQINLNFILYGTGLSEEIKTFNNVSYKGVLSSGEIVYKLEGDYGLVWDGDSIERIDGNIGNYLKYIASHKLSLYIAAGKPVIVWARSAVAGFVLKYKIGILINSLKDLEKIDLTCDYKNMCENINVLRKKVSSGLFLKSALSKSLEIIYEKNN